LITRLSRTPCWRLVTVRHAGVDIFQGLSDYGEWEELAEIESLTNERLKTAAGNLSLIPRERRAYGPGSAYVMAPFAYWAPGRFGTGGFGVLYAGLDEATARAEVFHHRARFLQATGTSREVATFQVLSLRCTGALEDIRSLAGTDLYDPAAYGPAQTFAAKVRAGNGDGIFYASVRRPGGECVAGFWPDLFTECRHVRRIQCFWDGNRLHGED
jgi:hypothetical protein